MLNIRTYTPVVLDMEDSSYGQWSRFFDTVFIKFSPHHHIDHDSIPCLHDPKWAATDAYV
jgi:hypothetical protein